MDTKQSIKRIFFSSYADADVCERLEKDLKKLYLIRIVFAFFFVSYLIINFLPIELSLKLLSMYMASHLIVYFFKSLFKDFLLQIYLAALVDIIFLGIVAYFLPLHSHFLIIAILQIIIFSHAIKCGLNFFWFTFVFANITEWLIIYLLFIKGRDITLEFLFNVLLFLVFVPLFMFLLLKKIGIPYNLVDYYIQEKNREKLEKERLKKLVIERTKELERLATTDSLTGLYNRRKLLEILEYEITRAKRYGNKLSIILFDIDNFKKINDTYGHDVGDYVLQQLAKIVKNNLRNIDTVGRWGGEEFLIILPQTGSEGARIVAEKIKKIIEKHNFDKVGKITISLGVSSFNPETDKNIDDLLKKADIALYQAKNSGKNQVKVFKDKNERINKTA